MNPAAMIQMTNAIGEGRLIHQTNKAPIRKPAPTTPELLEFLARHHDQAWTIAEICEHLDAELQTVHKKLHRHAEMKVSRVSRGWKYTKDGSYRHRAYQIKPEFVEAVLGVAA